jgi:hypothetical protein
MAVYQENLYLVDVPGGEARRLTDGGGVMTVTWQPGSWEVSDQSIDFSEESNLQGHQDWQEDIKSDPRRD